MAVSAKLKKLQVANPGLTIRDVADKAFAAYGRVLAVKAPKAVAWAKKNARIGEDIVYEPSVKGLEADAAFMKTMADTVYGGMPIQCGWCHGHNSALDGLEYHKGVEVVVAVTDTAVILGDMRDIAWGAKGATYASKKAEVFFIPAGTVVEFHAWCLHFAPIHTSTKAGFLTLVVLPKDTNTDIVRPRKAKGEDALLFARNKWLLVHASAKGLVKAGAAVGVTGANTVVRPLD